MGVRVGIAFFVYAFAALTGTPIAGYVYLCLRFFNNTYMTLTALSSDPTKSGGNLPSSQGQSSSSAQPSSALQDRCKPKRKALGRSKFKETLKNAWVPVIETYTTSYATILHASFTHSDTLLRQRTIPMTCIFSAWNVIYDLARVVH